MKKGFLGLKISSVLLIVISLAYNNIYSQSNVVYNTLLISIKYTCKSNLLKPGNVGCRSYFGIPSCECNNRATFDLYQSTAQKKLMSDYYKFIQLEEWKEVEDIEYWVLLVKGLQKTIDNNNSEDFKKVSIEYINFMKNLNESQQIILTSFYESKKIEGFNF
tara:strand:- start:661 stop:1146 length:486 start_codon:yes stop_codon:yes gene_type:complete